MAGISKSLGQRNYQYMDAMRIAVKEDSIAYWQKLNRGKKYQHADFEAGAADPE